MFDECEDLWDIINASLNVELLQDPTLSEMSGNRQSLSIVDFQSLPHDLFFIIFSLNQLPLAFVTDSFDLGKQWRHHNSILIDVSQVETLPTGSTQSSIHCFSPY